MKKILFILFVLIHFVFESISQEYDPYTYQDYDEKKVLSEKVFFGGGFGLQFGTFTLIKLTPEFGYRPTDFSEIGLGAYYMFSKNSIYNFSTHIYGGNIFARIFIFGDFYVQGEYELLNIDDFDYNTGYYNGQRVFIPGYLAGIGYRQKVGKRSAIMTTILYNFSLTAKTPYLNPVFRISFIY
jgi:hypothetical protein